MPNRIIKESICSNEQIDSLTPFEEVLFYRLIVNADDYGRFDGRTAIIRSRLFPLKSIRDDQIEKAIHALSSAELVALYYVGGKPFVRLTGWDKHQAIRAKKSKYPAPESENSDVRTSASNCNQMYADAIKCLRNPIQSESESNPNTNTKKSASVRFTPPTQEEVSAYCRERGNAVDPQRFVDFYAAKGWKVGNQPMKDWKAAVRTWEQRDQQRPGKTVSAQSYSQREYTEDQLLSIGDDLIAEARGRRETG